MNPGQPIPGKSIRRLFALSVRLQLRVVVNMFDIPVEYAYNSSIVWRIKNGEPKPPARKTLVAGTTSVDLTAKLFPTCIGTRMEANISYRRPDLRISISFLSIPQPENLTDPVRIHERGPPTNQTRYGYLRVTQRSKKPSEEFAVPSWAVIC